MLYQTLEMLFFFFFFFFCQQRTFAGMKIKIILQWRNHNGIISTHTQEKSINSPKYCFQIRGYS